MNREQIIEAMARAMERAEDNYEGTSEFLRYQIAAALTALETAIPGLADVIAGKAVIAPVEHASDCAVHNEPAYPAGPCDCERQLTRDDEQMFAEALIASSKQATSPPHPRVLLGALNDPIAPTSGKLTGVVKMKPASPK